MVWADGLKLIRQTDGQNCIKTDNQNYTKTDTDKPNERRTHKARKIRKEKRETYRQTDTLCKYSYIDIAIHIYVAPRHSA